MAETISRSRINISVTSEGTEVPGTYILTDISVKKDINKIPEATLTYSDGGVAQNEDFALVDSGIFDKGKKVVISAGYNNSLAPIFEGVVDSIELVIDKVNKMIVKCYNQAHFLTSVSMGTGVKLEGKGIHEAIKEVLSAYSGDVKNAVKEPKNKDALQKPQIVVDPFKTCWDFVKENLGSHIIIPEDQLLRIEPLVFKEIEKSEVEISYGDNLRSFKVKEHVDKLQAMKVQGYDLEDPINAEIKGDKKASELYSEFKDYMNADTGEYLSKIKDEEIITGTHINTQAEVDLIVETKKTATLLAFKSGSISIHGDNRVKLATMIEVEGLPTRFSKLFFIGGIEHKISKGWETVIKVGNGASGGMGKLAAAAGGGGGGGAGGISNQSDPAGSPVTGAKLSGNLTIGTVDSIHKDTEEGLYKIKVKLTKLLGDIVDARMMQPYAGIGSDSKPGEGTFFFPNVGSEVVLTPIEGDENNWVVLGCLYSKKVNKPSEELKKHKGDTQPDENNSHKAIVTKDFILDFFDDAEDPRFMIASRDDGKKYEYTDKKYSIAMHTKKDPHITITYDKTKIVMDKEGVLIDSAKNIVLKADSGDIEMSAKNIKMSGTADIGLDGQNITAAAKTNFDIEGMQAAIKGKTQVNIESSAIAALKGGATTKIG